MKNVYYEVQRSWFMIVLSGGFIVFLFAAYIYQWGDNPVPLAVCIPLSLVFLFCLLMFYEMRTAVDDKYVYVSYGIGLIKRQTPVREIGSVGIVKTPWYWGFGIKYSGGTTLLSIGFTPAVRMEFRGREKVLMIGTRNPEALTCAIVKVNPAVKK